MDEDEKNYSEFRMIGRLLDITIRSGLIVGKRFSPSMIHLLYNGGGSLGMDIDAILAIEDYDFLKSLNKLKDTAATYTQEQFNDVYGDMTFEGLWPRGESMKLKFDNMEEFVYMKKISKFLIIIKQYLP